MTITALATAPSRANTTITLSWGLLTIPLSVYTGTEETRVARKEFTRSDNGNPNHEVGRQAYNKHTFEVVDVADVGRFAEADSGAWVELTDDEIAACTSPRGLAEIVSFVPTKDAGQYLTQDVKQVRPKREKGKSNPAADKAFALLLTAMAKRKVSALIKVAMRGPARYALLDATGNLFLVATHDAVRGPLDLPTTKPTAQELALANVLIDAVGVEAPVLLDDTAHAVKLFVNNKAKGVTPPPPLAAPALGIDLMAQLQASIDATKAAAS